MKKHLKKVERKYNIEEKSNLNLVLTQNERNSPLPEGLFSNFLKSITEQDITFYPNLEKFKQKLRLHFKYSFLLTPGSDTAIKTFFELFNLKGKNVVTSDYHFPMYKVYSDLYQARLKFGKYKNMRLDIEDIIKEVDKNTAFIILANPNSPLGDYLEEKDIKKVLNLGIPVLIDEAYIECTSYNSVINLLDEYTNLYITRTFSKGYGAAGLRVGAIISTESNVEILSKFRFMYEVPSLSAKYCEYILDNKHIFYAQLKNSVEKKDKLVEYLSNKFTVINTDSLWFFLLDKDSKFANFLKTQKISMRKIHLPINSDQLFFKVNYDPMLENFIKYL